MIVVVVLAAGLAACRPTAGDPLNNPSLEEDAGGDGRPDCFAPEGWGSAAHVFDAISPGRTGDRAVRVRVTSAGDGERAWVPTMDDDCPPKTVGGERLVARVAYRSTVRSTWLVWIERATGWELWFRGPELPAAGAFTDASLVLPAVPAGATGVSFGVAPRSAGEVVTDDYVLERAAASTPAPAQPGGCPTGYAALTFDDGPAATTPGLLDVLRDRGVAATFFVIGENVVRAPATVARAASEGHVVGVHTWTHPTLTQLTDDEVRRELVRTADAIVAAGAPRPPLFRPPYGATDARVNDLGVALDLYPVLWSIDTNDWQGITVDETVRRALDPLRAGSVVLFHDRMANSVAAVPAIASGMRRRGICPGVLRPSWAWNPQIGGYAAVTAP